MIGEGEQGWANFLDAVRNRGELANPLLFYFIVATLFPLGVTSDPKTLATMAAAAPPVCRHTVPPFGCCSMAILAIPT